MAFGRKPSAAPPPEFRASQDDDADGDQFAQSQPVPVKAPVAVSVPPKELVAASPVTSSPTPIPSSAATGAYGRGPRTAPATAPTGGSNFPTNGEGLAPALGRIIELVGRQYGCAAEEVAEMKRNAIKDPEGAKACYAGLLTPVEDVAVPSDTPEKTHFSYVNEEAACVMSVPTQAPFAERFRGATIRVSGSFEEETANDCRAALLNSQAVTAKKVAP